MKTIIKGAIYFNGNDLLRPHYSGKYKAVKCTRYLTEERINEEFTGKKLEDVIGEYPITLILNNTKYYKCHEYGAKTVDMELISNLESLEYFDYENNFKTQVK